MNLTVSDVELVHSAQAGDVAALGLLLERHHARLYACALGLLRAREPAQDAVQESFLIALQRVGDLRQPAAAGAWLRAIVRSVCLMRLRAQRELPAAPGTFDLAGEDTVDAAIDRLTLRNWIWTALQSLPADLQATVILRHFTARSSYAEIAAVLALPVGTVRSRLHQARQRLAELLLETASSEHQEHQGLLAERWAWWTAAVDHLVEDGDPTIYAERCLADVLVEAPSQDYREVGIGSHQRGVARSAAAGVRLEVTDLLASADVTIIDGTYHNPPDDPHHCPATHTEVRLHPGGPTRRIVLHYPSETVDPES